MKFWILFIALITGSAKAASPLTVHEAVDIALSENPRLKAIELDAKTASAGKLKAWSAQLPHIGIKGQHVVQNEFQVLHVPFNGVVASFPAVTPYSIAALQGSLLLFDGFSSWDRISSASLAAKAQDAEISRARFALETDIRTKFYQALGASAMVTVADQNIATLEQHWKDVSARVKAGVATKFDVLRVEVLLEDAKTAKLAAEDARIIARKRLWQTLGVPDDGRELSGSLPETWDTLPSGLQPQPEIRDDRKAALFREESAMKASRASGKFWVPYFSLFAEYEKYNNRNKSLLESTAKFDRAYSVGIMASWNIFDGGRSIAERSELAAAEEKAALRIKEIDDAVPVDFELWRRRYVYSVAAFEAKRVAVRKAEESIRIARTGARAGIRTNTEVLDAVRDLNVEKAKLVQAQMDAVEALGNLELAFGRPLHGVALHAGGE